MTLGLPAPQPRTDEDPAFGREIVREVSLAPLHEVLNKILAFATNLVDRRIPA